MPASTARAAEIGAPTVNTDVPNFDLTGRVAVITAGSRGLGRSICLALAHAGATVVVSSRQLEPCETLAQEIKSATGREAAAFACHIGDWNQVDTLADFAYDRFGKVDVLVNNAGLSPSYQRLTDVTEELWDKVIGVNLKGAFRLSAVVGERMVAAGGGSIINVSSSAAEQPRADVVPYAAAKAAVNNMTVGLAYALGPNVRVNCVQPGPFHTDMTRGWDQADFEAQSRVYALKRGGQPEEIAGAVLYLASEASSFTTGAVIRVDGGYRWS